MCIDVTAAILAAMVSGELKLDVTDNFHGGVVYSLPQLALILIRVHNSILISEKS